MGRTTPRSTQTSAHQTLTWKTTFTQTAEQIVDVRTTLTQTLMQIVNWTVLNSNISFGERCNDSHTK